MSRGKTWRKFSIVCNRNQSAKGTITEVQRFRIYTYYIYKEVPGLAKPRFDIVPRKLYNINTTAMNGLTKTKILYFRFRFSGWERNVTNSNNSVQKHR